MTRPVVVLGATGSIGRQTLEVTEALGWPVVAVAARRARPALAEIAARFPAATVAVAEGPPDAEFSRAVGRPVRWGIDEVVALAATPGAVVVNGIVGAAGLRASVQALEAGNRLALANKESLVAGGPVLMDASRRGGGELVPVDSEHSALFQLLAGVDPTEVARLVLTASGGPFRGRSVEELAKVTPEEALAHPTWRMGARITVDSATLANKGLEVIEARFLFDVPYERIAVVVHPQSAVHSFVELVDGALLAHVGAADMRIPIQYALTHPERAPCPAAEPFDLVGRSFTFEAVDREAFPMLDLAYAAGRRGGSAPAVFNAADEVAVEAFLGAKIGFLEIPFVVEATLAEVDIRPIATVDDVVEVDRDARRRASATVERMS